MIYGGDQRFRELYYALTGEPDPGLASMTPEKAAELRAWADSVIHGVGAPTIFNPQKRRNDDV